MDSELKAAPGSIGRRTSTGTALVALLGLLTLRIFEACGASIADLEEEYGHRVLRVRGKGGKVVLVPLPPAVSRAIGRAAGERDDGPILRNTLGGRTIPACSGTCS